MSDLLDKSQEKNESTPPLISESDPHLKPLKPSDEPAEDALPSPKAGPLTAAWAELERGDHVKARELAIELSKSADLVVSKEANEFIERMKPDPVILLVLLGTAILIAFLAVQYLGPHLPHTH